MKVMVVEEEQTDLEKLKHVIRQAEPAAEIICVENYTEALGAAKACLLYTSPSPRDRG